MLAEREREAERKRERERERKREKESHADLALPRATPTRHPSPCATPPPHHHPVVALGLSRQPVHLEDCKTDILWA